MKKRTLLAMALTLVMCFGLVMPAWAAEQNINAIEDNTNVSIEDMMEPIELFPNLPNGRPDDNASFYGTSVPTEGYDLSKGDYHGEFQRLTHSRMYTNKYFYVANKYFVRIKCNGEYPSLPFQLHNYCVTCGETITSTDEMETPSTPNVDTAWHSFTFYTGANHAGHYLCPYVTNNQSKLGALYGIDGTIEVSNTKF